jgi:alkanesulfonate monooxygenase SsuD/methylene tetrahydromethanopterin reductase-like flavin-dependent oxidoreductase (luciferase family)
MAGSATARKYGTASKNATARENAMKFSLYSEMQYWGGKSWAQMYEEVMEQVVNADRLGYDAYAIIEHFFFPKFSISPDPMAFFVACAQRTKRITFRTLVHVLPYHNPTALASRIAAADLLLNGRYEFGVGRGHGWLPPKAGIPLAESRARYQESLEILFRALEHERFSYDGTYYKIHDSHVVPRPHRKFRMFLGGTSDETYVLAGQRGWAMVVPPLLPYEALRAPLDLYRATCTAHGNTPDIVWIHACYIDEDRDIARREAEQGMRNFLRGNASPLTEGHEMAPAEELVAAGYGFYASGTIEKLAEMPYDEMLAGDVVWVGTPHDIIERIEAMQALCEGLTEVSITVNAGGFAHWQSIKTQELFAHKVIPHFRTTGVEERQSQAAGR